MKNEEFQESVTDIVLEPIKAIPKKVIENIWDKKQLEEMFIDAGRWVINYERDGTEESELRSIAFCEENMRAIADYMYHQDPFRWFEVLQKAIHAHLKESGMSARNQQNCENHFLEIIGKCMRERHPVTVERSMQQETVNGVRILNKQNSQMLQMLMENNELLRSYHNAKEETGKLVQKIVDYWNVLREKLEDQKHRAWEQEEYLNRARKTKRTAAAICRNSEILQYRKKYSMIPMCGKISSQQKKIRK